MISCAIIGKLIICFILLINIITVINYLNDKIQRNGNGFENLINSLNNPAGYMAVAVIFLPFIISYSLRITKTS